MASSQAAQKAIDKDLDLYRKNPMQPLELAAIAEMLKDPNVSASQFKPFLRRDPILCAALVHQGYLATRNRASHPFAAEHALTTIGLGGLEAIVNRYKGKPAPELSQEVQFYLSANLLAAEIGRQLTGDDHTYWHCLFYGTPDTMMWYLHPRAMWHIVYRRAWRPRNLRVFEETKLGFNLLDWRKSVSKRWHLDEKAEAIFATPIPNDPRELLQYIASDFHRIEIKPGDWRDSEGLKVVTCNFLARAVLNPWFRNAEFHYRSLLKRAFRAEANKVKHALVEAVRIVSTDLMDSPLPNPARCWLMRPSKAAWPDWLVRPTIDKSKVPFLKPDSQKTAKQTVKKASGPTAKTTVKPTATQKATSVTKPAAKPAPKKAASITPTKPAQARTPAPTEKSAPIPEPTSPTGPAIDLKLAGALFKKMTNEPKSFPTDGWLMQEFLEALIKGLGFDHAVYLGVEYQNKRAITKLSQVNKDQTKLRFGIDFSQPTPLIKFVSKETIAVLSKKQHGSIWPKLPKEILHQQVTRFLFASIAPRDKVRVMIYADGEKVSDDNWQRAKKLCKGLSVAMKARTSNPSSTSP